MQRQYLAFLGLVALLTVSACGQSGAPGTAAVTGTKATSATPQMFSSSPTPIGSVTQTPQGLPLHTDRSHYRPTDVITATITNTSSITLYAWDTQASCSIFDLEVSVQGQWQSASVARCPLGRRAFMITLAAGEQYQVSIQAQTPGLNTATFPDGTYRVALSYAAVPAIQAATTRVVSAPFQVQDSSNP